MSPRMIATPDSWMKLSFIKYNNFFHNYEMGGQDVGYEY